MPVTRTAKAPKKAAAQVRFSLVPTSAQQQMYAALAELEARRLSNPSGAEVAEIAASLALAPRDIVILAAEAEGAAITGKAMRPASEGIIAATAAAVEKLIPDDKSVALICAGQIGPELTKEHKQAFSFAVRHKLPILFLLSNSLNTGRRKPLDLRTLYAEIGLYVISVDAGEAIASYRVTTEALHQARHMRGPCLIEALQVEGPSRVESSPLELLRRYMERHGSSPAVAR